MKLSEKQGIFLLNVSKLIQFVNDRGWWVTGGRLYSTVLEQLAYFESGASKTKMGQHPKRLAIDLNLFIDGAYQTNKEAYKPLALFWKSLHEDNRAGYDWGWDANHFEMK